MSNMNLENKIDEELMLLFVRAESGRERSEVRLDRTLQVYIWPCKEVLCSDRELLTWTKEMP